MKEHPFTRPASGVRLWRLLLSLLLAGMLVPIHALAVTINVKDPAGAAVTDYRWLIEEDAMKPTVAGQPEGPGGLSFGFHRSYMPVVASGRVGTNASGLPPSSIALDPNKRYFISVLPDGGAYQMGGAPLPAGQNSVNIVVVNGPIPTAQISVFAFEDTQPINNSPDLPQEKGLAGFTVLLAEAGGTYGQSGGQVIKDAYNNPIGTTYKKTNCAGSVSPASGYCVDGAGQPEVETVGSGVVYTGADGTVRIRNLVPAKYTIQIVPPAGSGWRQTTTIEGTKGIDAWVVAREPSYSFLVEPGQPLPHVFMGFVKPFTDSSVLNGSNTITGKAVNQHMSMPFQNFNFYNGDPPVVNCIIGLNDTGAGKGVFSKPCNPDGTFSIPNVPPGSYQLVVWDEYLDRIINFSTVTVPDGQGAEIALQEVPVFNWFNRFQTRVFYDANQNGFPDPGEVGIPEQAVNLRFRDGSIYQSYPTDINGEVVFEEVFPFFYWLVAEVDFARFKATGATIAVDQGGPVPPHDGWNMPSYNALNPQEQADTNPNTNNKLSRTQTGPVLLQGYQGFLGQTNVIEWGKINYEPGHNGGISGIVYYASTRAENDPRYAAAENNEPGVPRVQVNLYKDCNADGIPDKSNCTASTGLNALRTDVVRADVDNYPFCWSDTEFAAGIPSLCPNGQARGPEDDDHNNDGVFDQGDALQIAHTDSWDDNLPSGCPQPPYTINGVTLDCVDGLRSWNQVRPAVFDGGYAFGGAASSAPEDQLPPGTYIVEAVPPHGYETLREEHKNVDFGDSYTPSPLLLPPACVGGPHNVPAELSLLPGVPSAYAGQTRPLCDQKTIEVKQGQNAAVNFFVLTEVPIAGHIVGFTANDVGNEFNPNSPLFGEKYAPPHMPVSIRDWTGREVSRFYAGQFGAFNALVPATYSYNIPFPSGVSPNMLTACMNSPGPIPDPANPGALMVDPYFSRNHSQMCYPFQFLPGKTTYLDTPVVSVSAFADNYDYPLDCELTAGTPMIHSVEGYSGNTSNGGPFIRTAPGNANPLSGQRLVIKSLGTITVVNPDFNNTPGSSRTITRDLGFGATRGTGSVVVNGTPVPSANIFSWSNTEIVINVPNSMRTGQLEVRRGNGKSTVAGVTVTVDASAPKLVPSQYASIQAAIDAAVAGDLILVAPGTYDELVIMYKKVRLQGWGAGSTIINGTKTPADKLEVWRAKVASLYAAGAFDLVPGQTTTATPGNPDFGLFGAEAGSGVLVVAKASGPNAFNNAPRARIDGFMITGADLGGAIFASGYAKYLQISNNKLVTNQGAYGGGIRVGHPALVSGLNPATDLQRGGYTDSDNDNVLIANNHIAQNGGFDGAGAGVSLYAGSDNYQVTQNFICGNFSLGNGGGIGHLGLSNNGTISMNTVVFNETFNQGTDRHGGGIFVGGQAPLAANGLSPGAGSVTIDANLVQGNLAGVGDGGGIRAQAVSGLDIRRAPGNSAAWYRLTATNNMVTNNVAGLAGGGISLQDSVLVNVANNTIANNDSTATTGAAFAAGNPNQSTPQPAGLVARAHSALLFNTIAANSPYKLQFTRTNFVNNILWHNRSFYWEINPDTEPATFGLIPNVAAGQATVYSDLGVLGTPQQGTWPLYATGDRLLLQNSILTNVTGYGGNNGNIAANPMFDFGFVNGDPRVATPGRISTAAAFDEGGNFIAVRYGPLTLNPNECTARTMCPSGQGYHLLNNSPAEAAGRRVNGVTPNTDFDGQTRPSQVDIGADERD
jgi:large repetitive protein